MKKLPYRLFWTWDHSTNWCLNVRGSQNTGVANYYTKDAKFFVRDYKRAIDWCAAHKMNAMGAVGLLRDAHGGIDSVREICEYARGKGVIMYLIAGLFSYGGIYYEGDSRWSLDRFLTENPDCMGRAQDGSFLRRQQKGYGGNKIILTGCPSNDKLNDYIAESVDWLFKAIPELGGIQMESGDVGVCQCPKCQERRRASENVQEMSFNDMARIYARCAKIIWNQNPDAWVICESYRHFLDPECSFFSSSYPSPELKELLALPEKTFWQWKCDRRLKSGAWQGEELPEPLKKFRHIMRAHSGTQWWGGRHTLAVELIRKQCLLSYKSGIQGVSLFGEGSVYHTNVEMNYLALEYFSDHPENSLADFAEDVMSPLLGGKLRAEKYLEFGVLNKTPEKIPAAAAEIAKIMQGITDYDVIRRWEYLASFLNSFYWEFRHPDYEERIETNNNNML